jgi:[acyl-carrier-protein] S-malonyltransferase
MANAGEKLEKALYACSVDKPKIPVVSNVTAEAYKGPDDIRELLKRQITETVQWQKSTQMVHDVEGGREWLVLGPAKVLTNLMKRDYPGDRIVSLNTVEDIAKFVEDEKRDK